MVEQTRAERNTMLLEKIIQLEETRNNRKGQRELCVTCGDPLSVDEKQAYGNICGYCAEAVKVEAKP